LPEQYSAMTEDELYGVITQTLYVEETVSGIRFKSKRRAEYLERVLHRCASCGSVGTLASAGSYIRCGKCGMTAEYTEKLSFRLVTGSRAFPNVKKWYDWQQEALSLELSAGEYRGKEVFSDENVRLFVYRKGERKRLLDCGRVSLGEKGFMFKGSDERGFPVSEVSAATALGKNKLNFYVGGDIYQLKGDARFNSLKYFDLFDLLKAESRS